MADKQEQELVRRLRQENAELRAQLTQLQRSTETNGVTAPNSSESLSLVMNHFPGVLVLYDAERRIQFANSVAVEIAGYYTKDLIGHRDEELFPSEITSNYLPLLQLAMATRAAQSGEFTIALTSGKYSVRVTYVPLLDQQGNIRQVLGITQDISKQISAERTVHELEARFAKAFHASPVASVISHLEDGTIVDLNESFMALFGYARAELIGRSAAETGLWVHPEERAQLVAQVRDGTTIRGMPAVERRKTGEPRQMLLSAHKIEIGGTDCLITHLEDITERQRAAEEIAYAEKQVQRSHEQFRALAEYTPDVVVRLDRECRMTYVNSTASKLTGVPAEEFVGKTFEEMRVPGPLIPVWTEHVLWVLKHGKPTMMEFEYPTLVGPRTYETQLVPEFDPNGRVTHVLTVSRDITERKQANYELEQRVLERTAELEAANRELETFSYSVSHDLRTPLATLDSLLTLVAAEFGPALPKDAQKYLGYIHENAKAMDKLIQALLRFSRTTRQPVRKERLSIADLVRETIDALKAEQAGRQIEIVIGELPDANADPVLIKQVLANLLSNAFKFTRQREVAHIEISSYEKDGQRIYYVKDDGVGFDMDQAEKLFGVFQRLHAEEDYEGTGVGLALVERIIRRHGGWVCADAKVDGGATFFFTLP